MSTTRIEVEGDVLSWSRDGERLDPAEGMADLFGRFELTSRLPGLHAPGQEVLTYQAPTPRAARRLSAIPAGRWLRVDDTLWLTHDGRHLLLSPTTKLHTENLLKVR